MMRLKYRRCEVFVDSEDEKKKVRAYELASFPEGLVAHKRKGDRWFITRKPSGLLMSFYSYDTLQEALRRIKQLYDLSFKENFDWNSGEENLEEMSSSLVSKVEEILREERRDDESQEQTL